MRGAWDRLRGHPLGGHADKRLIAFVWSRVGKDLDVDVLLAELQLLQRQANRLVHGVGLDFDAGHSPLIHRFYPRLLPSVLLSDRLGLARHDHRAGWGAHRGAIVPTLGAGCGPGGSGRGALGAPFPLAVAGPAAGAAISGRPGNRDRVDFDGVGRPCPAGCLAVACRLPPGTLDGLPLRLVHLALQPAHRAGRVDRLTIAANDDNRVKVSRGLVAKTPVLWQLREEWRPLDEVAPAGDEPLLDHAVDTLCRPVEDRTGGEAPAEEDDGERHDVHD